MIVSLVLFLRMKYIFIVLLGLCLGSFINAFVWRFHQQTEHPKDKIKYSITRGRSICPTCKHQLKAYDLIPVVSWLLLGGKCRYCKKPISSQYPIVESLTTVLFVLSLYYWPYNLGLLGWVTFTSWLAVMVIYISLAVYDLKWRLLPDKLVLLSTVFVLVFVVLRYFLGDYHIVDSYYFINEIFSALIIVGLFYGLFYFSRGKWIGGGDVKLGLSLGLLAGSVEKAILLLFVASLTGCVVVIPMLLYKKLRAKSQIPFGPLLIFGSFVCVLFGTQIISWYQSLLVR